MAQNNNNQAKKKIKDPKEIVEEVVEALPPSQKLVLDPDSLMGVASAYRYKLTVLNPELERCALYFDDSMDVFGFNDVNKKRALKKQDWPTNAPEDHPRRYNVKVQLMAGNAEIKSCRGCSMWKDLTTKPFLVLTPHGSRCVEFTKSPFVLLIFRCCPKFHSYTKQFSLRVTITHGSFSDIVYSTEVIIHRKKMNSALLKKRKGSGAMEEEDDEEDFFEQQVCQEEKRPRHALETSQPITSISQQAKTPLPEIPSSFSPINSFESSKYPDLESVLALHETLFPNEAKLFKPSNEGFNFNPNEVVLSSNPLASKPNKNKSLTQQPFQQYQEEFEWVNAHFEGGQHAPQQWGTPQQFFDFLYNKKPAKTVHADPTVLQTHQNQILKKPILHAIAPAPVVPDMPTEIPNDEKWLTTVLDDIPFSNDLFRFDDINLFPFEAN